MAFVMPPAGGAATDPDPRQQVPFEPGDYIIFNGSLVHPAQPAPTTPPAPPATPVPDYISAHTIQANVGAWTQPGTQPSYVQLQKASVASDDPNPLSPAGVDQIHHDRMIMEAATTDVQNPVDVYMTNTDASTGAVKNRWVTPFEMTGENPPAGANPGGGITTQNTGPIPWRVRLRANKAPVGLLPNPTRTLRIMQRSLCTPRQQLDQSAVDSCVANAPVVANGLIAGQYVAPVFDWIFPAAIKPGAPVVPADFWHLGFLRFGEGAAAATPTPLSVGPLEPTPW
jgi:hypothetical protein